MNSVSEFINWLFGGRGPEDLSDLIRLLAERPAFAFYFALLILFVIALLAVVFRFALPRPMRLGPPQWNIWTAALIVGATILLMNFVGGIMLSSAPHTDRGIILPLSYFISMPAGCVFGYFVLRGKVPSIMSDIGVSPVRALTGIPRGVLVLAAMYPLFLLVSQMSILYLKTIGADTSPQAVVEEMRASTGAGKIMLIVMAVAVAPICEEFLFRGVLFNGLRRSIGADEAIFVSALLFMAMHPFVIDLVPIFFLAVFLAYAYERTGNLWVPIGMHSLFNSISVLLLFSA